MQSPDLPAARVTGERQAEGIGGVSEVRPLTVVKTPAPRHLTEVARVHLRYAFSAARLFDPITDLCDPSPRAHLVGVRGRSPTDSNCADHLVTQLDDNAAGPKEHSRRRLEAGLLLEPFSELPAGLKIQHRRRE